MEEKLINQEKNLASSPSEVAVFLNNLENKQPLKRGEEKPRNL